ncbi:MAG TPA: hypothetical protein PK473_06850, partial [Nitrosomonas sp.]|nr:hypothetical protein [Nitrosomonas sp.]
MLKYDYSLSKNEQIALFFFIIGLITVFSLLLFSNKSEERIAESSTHLQQDLTKQFYQQKLQQREAEILEVLKHTDPKHRRILEVELQDIQLLLQDIDNSFLLLKTSINDRLKQLEVLHQAYPIQMLEQAIMALRQANDQQAIQLFRQIEKNNEHNPPLAAEAAYQLSKLAEDSVRYTAGLEHAEKAIRLIPNNALYLSAAGFFSDKLAHYKKAISYHEQA